MIAAAASGPSICVERVAQGVGDAVRDLDTCPYGAGRGRGDQQAAAPRSCVLPALPVRVRPLPVAGSPLMVPATSTPAVTLGVVPRPLLACPVVSAETGRRRR